MISDPVWLNGGIGPMRLKRTTGYLEVTWKLTVTAAKTHNCNTAREGIPLPRGSHSSWLYANQMKKLKGTESN